MDVQVISKATGNVSQMTSGTVSLNAPSIVRPALTRAEIAGFERQEHDLVIRLANGEQTRIANFYPGDAPIGVNDLVLREGDGSLWLARVDATALRFSAIRDLDDLLAGSAAGGGSSLALPVALLSGLAAAGGVVAAASAGSAESDDSGEEDPGDGGDSPPIILDPGAAPDRDAPDAPDVIVRDDGTRLDGSGEPGATIAVLNGDGTVVGTTVVEADGTFSVIVSPRGGRPGTDGDAGRSRRQRIARHARHAAGHHRAPRAGRQHRRDREHRHRRGRSRGLGDGPRRVGGGDRHRHRRGGRQLFRGAFTRAGERRYAVGQSERYGGQHLAYDDACITRHHGARRPDGRGGR
ncbi:BapA prefix-like domain-containing protein [Sphingomonas solaris]|uniref:BapA prefix-like domain-containing protein n=1 Tax=Alterirhizorhabdus solaris TaxID=2529389 RepID=A0A558R4G8_9SPHN|nr:BapA prefix-like domain-containing protein [Sphingomonas solaris]TVV74259.1 BapA prefix-like domain-containing protein [Sphingomonas solaris]